MIRVTSVNQKRPLSRNGHWTDLQSAVRSSSAAVWWSKSKPWKSQLTKIRRLRVLAVKCLTDRLEWNSSRGCQPRRGPIRPRYSKRAGTHKNNEDNVMTDKYWKFGQSRINNNMASNSNYFPPRKVSLIILKCKSLFEVFLYGAFCSQVVMYYCTLTFSKKPLVTLMFLLTQSVFFFLHLGKLNTKFQAWRFVQTVECTVHTAVGHTHGGTYTQQSV